MKPNNTFERTVRHCGPRLAAAQASWPAAQLGRYASRDSSRVCASVPSERWSSGKRRLAIEGNGDVSAILVAGGKAGESTSFCNQEREQMNKAVLAGRNLVQPGFALARAGGVVALGTATHNTAFERTTMRATRSALWPRAAQLGRYASRDSSRVCASVPGERWSSGNRQSATRGNVGVPAILVAGVMVSESTSYFDRERKQVNNAVLAGRNLVALGFALAWARGTVARGTATHNTAFERTTLRATRSALWPRAAQLGR